jgi:deoxyribodipyrimidine photo-lyase
LNRCKEYIWDTLGVGHYSETRNDLIGAAYSSKLSPWLSDGSLSPRYVYHQVKEFERKKRANDSTKTFIDELFWRDYYRFWAMRYGNKIFSSYG